MSRIALAKYLGSAYVRSCHIILGVGGELESRYLVATFMKGSGEQDKSWPAIMRSFEDLAGPVVAGRWGGILLFSSSDLEYACVDLGLRSYGARKM